MYAIVNISGQQYRVREKEQLSVASLAGKNGDKLKFDQVLLLDDGKKIKIGSPHIKNASVSAEIVEHGRQRKVIVFKKKRRKGYQRKNGHRQGYTLIQINKISTAKAARKKADAAPAKEAGEEKGNE